MNLVVRIKISEKSKLKMIICLIVLIKSKLFATSGGMIFSFLVRNTFTQSMNKESKSMF